jgi:hypothetical protein
MSLRIVYVKGGGALFSRVSGRFSHDGWQWFSRRAHPLRDHTMTVTDCGRLRNELLPMWRDASASLRIT